MSAGLYYVRSKCVLIHRFVVNLRRRTLTIKDTSIKDTAGSAIHSSTKGHL